MPQWGGPFTLTPVIKYMSRSNASDLAAAVQQLFTTDECVVAFGGRTANMRRAILPVSAFILKGQMPLQ